MTKFNIEKNILAVKTFLNRLNNNPNARYRSWEHCYIAFCNARKESSPDIDILSLHLSFYLASWGMYRGSSFLLQRDYRIHKEAVIKLLDHKWDKLVGINNKNLADENNLTLIKELADELNKIYSNIRKNVYEEKEKLSYNGDDEKSGLNGEKHNSKISDILITKILMGTLGCTPAYDRYFCSGVRKTGIASGVFTKSSLKALAIHYKNNKPQYERIRKSSIMSNGQKYPQMKILDMAFWQLGLDLDKS